MWRFYSEAGRQVWHYVSGTEEIEENHDRPTTTDRGIKYFGLPFMTNGVVHTHMLEGGASKPSQPGERHVEFDPKLVHSEYDIPNEVSLEQVQDVLQQSLSLTNPNTGDDVYRKQALPADLFMPGSAASIPKELNNPNTKTIFRKDVGEGETKETVDINISDLSIEEFTKLVEATADDGANFFQHILGEDGHVSGDYAGPMFLLPGLVITCYATRTHLPVQSKLEMIKYMLSHSRPDGGWGLHIESRSTVFGTALTYVSLRLLGCPADLPPLKKALKWIHENGGAGSIPSWGKFWLAVANVFPWEGTNSVFPELWLLPTFLPFHPSRFWCHCRMVYLPMAYIQGARFQMPEDDLVRAMRVELFGPDWKSIDYTKFRSQVAKTDLYTPTSTLMKCANFALNLYETYVPKVFRPAALKFILEYVTAEDISTNYVDIGPVSKFINMLCCYHGYGKDSLQFRLHQSRIVDYLWVAEDGMKCQGYNGSQLWDTAFAVQAYLELEEGRHAQKLLVEAKANKAEGKPQRNLNEDQMKNSLLDSVALSPYRNFFYQAYKYVEMSQVRQEVQDREKFFRHISLGGWPFSTRDHGWPISDCTAEGLKAAILLHKAGIVTPTNYGSSMEYINEERQFQAINVILSMQNYQDGGWATYENTRGPEWLELINPAEVFGGIMIDYSYIECTSACVQALVKFQHMHPNHRPEEIKKSLADAMGFVKNRQRADGSWVGSWAICFMYAGWFGLEALMLTGETYKNSESVRKGCAFILSKQNEDGGWGESYESCVTKKYVPVYNKRLISNGGQDGDDTPLSMVISTAWAVMALLAADYQTVDRKPLDKAIKFLMSRQLPNGDWPQEGISGVFNGNCMITYTAYRSVFPIWAIGRYLTKTAELDMASL